MHRTLLAASAFVIVLAPSAYAQDAVDFAPYMQSPAAISAIASGVSMASGCSVPLQFDEELTDTGRTLGIHCRGTADDEMSVFLLFDDYGEGNIFLRGIELAG